MTPVDYRARFPRGSSIVTETGTFADLMNLSSLVFVTRGNDGTEQYC